MKLNEQIKELVSQSVYETVDKSTDMYVHLGKIQESMNRIEKAGAKLGEYKNVDDLMWNLSITVRGSLVLNLGTEDVLSPLILETLKQLMDLLEAIHYSERKAAIIEFNNSLKKADDGSSTEE